MRRRKIKIEKEKIERIKERRTVAEKVKGIKGLDRATSYSLGNTKVP